MTARLACAIGLLVLASWVAPAGQGVSATLGGVVVESVGPPWSGASKAGLRPGDVITAWALPATGLSGTREVAGLADWAEAEAEHSLRAEGIVVSVVRDGAPFTTTLTGGAWLLGVGPRLEGDVALRHARALAAAASGEQPAAAALWRELAAEAEGGADPSLQPWFALRAGGAEMAARNAAGAQASYAAARRAARERGQTLLEREALDGLGRAHQASQQPVEAETAWNDAVALMQTERPASPVFVRALNALAAFEREFGRLDESQRTYQRALEAARTICPGSIAEVASLGGLSLTLRRRGNLADAERLLNEAEVVLERFPDHPDRIANAVSRGILLVEQNRLSEGEGQLRLGESLDRARGTPANAIAMGHHGNLGVVAAQRGDFTRAEGYFRSFMDAAERASMNPLDLVGGASNLAVVASERGDVAGALAGFELALALAAKAAPQSDTMADVYGNLGTARARAGDERGSTAAYEEALRLRLQMGEDAPGIAALLWSMAANALRRGDLEQAADMSARAVAQVDQTSPGGLAASRAYHMAAKVALARGRHDDARTLQEQGLAFARAMAPGSRLEAAALATLAHIDVAEGRLERAAGRYAEAMAALGLQVRRLGATLDHEAGYVDAAGVQRPYIDVLLRLDRPAEALEVIERSHAGALLARLAARDMTFGRGVEAADLTRERRRLARAYDDVLGELERLPAQADAVTVDRLQGRLAEIRASQALASSNLRRVDPDLAEQFEPAPRTLADLQRTIPEGTLALVYHLGASRSVVFAVSRHTFKVVALATSAEQLAERVDTWRRLVNQGASGAEPAGLSALSSASAALFDVLLRPVEDDAARVARLVIVPDGVLHGLSFAALERRAGAATAERPEARFVAQWRPTSVVASLTTLARLGARPLRQASTRRVAAFGDAVSGDPSEASADPGERALRGGLVAALEPLPGSRREAESVAKAFAPAATLWLGTDATEEAIKRLPRDTSILHVATHGVTNDALPLDSALVLSASGGEDNGLLQAWEIFDQVRLDADLVVLSACETGLGRTYSGEGLLGLTRAFQFAGARAVAASLWKAPDEATATLMAAFYGQLRAGVPTDEALATAQRTLLTSPGTSHPFFWAGFVLDGDGR